MKTILIIIASVYGGYNSSTTEFSNKEACEIAAQRVVDEARWGASLTAFCVTDGPVLLDYRTGEPVR